MPTALKTLEEAMLARDQYLRNKRQVQHPGHYALHQHGQAKPRQFSAELVIGTTRVRLPLEARMPRTGSMPNGISSEAGKVVYLVVDRVGSPRDQRCQTKVERTDIETIISNLIAGQFNDPLRVVAFNTLGHWSSDISAELASEIQARCDIEAVPVPEHIRDFVLSYTG